ncbi:MAG: 2-oxoacid:acceptor oxidoreductase subunit alpha [Actinobacteria bacterium]|nr:2-oxoacid:acceptor oxidoreductase subunit alpha [Actinomycetota bacterium]
MNELSILIGGKAGDGINQSGLLIARLLSQIGYYIYMYFDYPSLIRGGHNFSIVRASQDKIGTHTEKIDFLLALNSETIDLHKNRLGDNSLIIYDSDSIDLESLPESIENYGIPLKKIIKQEKASPIMRNSSLLGTFSKSIGVKWEITEKVFKKNILKEVDLNLKLARRGYNESKELIKIEPIQRKVLPILSGNESIGLGLINAGLKTYIAYPMTPSSTLLHFLAQLSNDFNLKVIHPENEIAVILMALGFSYAGERVAIGTSGGGFCLMTEGLSLSGMAELPVVIVIAQRPGPSTGVPTYTAQGDLSFALNAGHGEFIRLVVAPGDTEQAYFWSSFALNISWKYQIPSIILTDKTLSEGTYSFDINSIEEIKNLKPLLWDKKGSYKRYLNTENGLSPLAYVPDKKAIIKVNSYEHDEYGLTTEEPQKIKLMSEKRMRKEKYLNQEIQNYEPIKVFGDKNSSTILLCWGSNKGVCSELGEKFGLKVVQPVIISPFQLSSFQEALKGAKKIISVENNVTGQLSKIISGYGFKIDREILKHDGRPFSLEELESRLKELEV